MNPLAVERSSVEGCQLLAVEGELDLASAPRMITALNEAVAQLRLPLVVDLSKVDFMDSTGLALLINLQRRVRKLGQGFAIVRPSGPTSRVFEITDMTRTLRVCVDLATALRVASQPVAKLN